MLQFGGRVHVEKSEKGDRYVSAHLSSKCGRHHGGVIDFCTMQHFCWFLLWQIWSVRNDSYCNEEYGAEFYPWTPSPVAFRSLAVRAQHWQLQGDTM